VGGNQKQGKHGHAQQQTEEKKEVGVHEVLGRKVVDPQHPNYFEQAEPQGLARKQAFQELQTNVLP
jgi:hypothetical protein